MPEQRVPLDPQVQDQGRLPGGDALQRERNLHPEAMRPRV